MSKHLLSIVIPVWNEENTLAILVDKVMEVKFPKNVDTEIIIVNDASADGSRKIAEKLCRSHRKIHCYNNSKNLGKSQTVKRGILKTAGDYVVIQDADLEYDPDELANLISMVLKNGLDVAYGNRFGTKNEVVYWRNYLGNRFLSFVSNLFTYPRIRVWIPDMEVCHKMIRGDVARELAANLISTTRFGLEPEITARLSRHKPDGKHLKFGVAPTIYTARTIAEGKKMSAFSDGIKALKEILTFNLKKV